MPKVSGAPKALNSLLEKEYAKALKQYSGSKTKASKVAWAAAEEAGWKKDKEGNWMQKKKKEHSVPVAEHQIFEAGTHVTKSGEKVVYTQKELDELCETFDPNEPVAYIPGHSSDWPGVTMIPRLGNICAGLKRVGDKIYAVGAEFSDRLAGWVREGFYTQRSCEIGKDENGKCKLYAVAMLGAQPPAVKGMPPLSADMLTPEFLFSKPESAVYEFAESVDGEMTIEEHIDEVEIKGKEATKKDIAERLADMDKSIEEMIDEECDHDRMIQVVYEHVNDICQLLDIHDAFMDRLEDLEEEQEGEYSQRKSFWQEFAKIFKRNPQQKEKEAQLDAQKEKDYLEKIAQQEKELKEFAEANKAAEQKAADDKLRASIHEFCVKNSFDTNKAKELKVEETLFLAAKADGLIEFSATEKKSTFDALTGILSALKLSPTLGELQEFADNQSPKKSATNPKKEQAEKYIKDHPEEFAKMEPKEALRSALIKFL
jgi:hypothetical protein